MGIISRQRHHPDQVLFCRADRLAIVSLSAVYTQVFAEEEKKIIFPSVGFKTNTINIVVAVATTTAAAVVAVLAVIASYN